METAVEKLEKEIFGRITRRQPHGTIITQGQEETLIELFQESGLDTKIQR